MTHKSKIPTHTLTIYLIKEGYNSPQNILKTEEGLEKYTITLNGSLSADLFIKHPKQNTPKWAKFFKDILDIQKAFGLTQSVSAVLLVKVEERMFAVAFGQGGRHLLARDCYEERFGLKVALNCIGEDRIRCIDKRTLDAISRLSIIQSSRESTAQAFGLDVEQDLLRAIIGKPHDITLGHRMVGKDPLIVTLKIEPDDLPTVLSRYYNKYLDDSYKKTFPWVDHMAEVTSKTLIETLNNILIENIKNKVMVHQIGPE